MSANSVLDLQDKESGRSAEGKDKKVKKPAAGGSKSGTSPLDIHNKIVAQGNIVRELKSLKVSKVL